MYTLTLTLRRGTDGPRVWAEAGYSGVAAGPRVEESLALDPALLPAFPQTVPELRAYGVVLGAAVFRGRVLAAFLQAQARADQAGQPLHVLLAVEDEALRAVRWERLCGPRDGGWEFLHLQQRTPFSFHMPSAVDKRYPAIGRVDLRDLVVVADMGPGGPYGLPAFDAAGTVAAVRAALGEVPCRVLACSGPDPVPGADGLPTLDEICRQVTAERFPVLHVVCHGKFFTGSGDTLRGTILFLRKDGPVDPRRRDDHVARVTDAELIDRLANLQGARSLPHLTFLCSCETAAPEAEQGLGGLGQRFVRELGTPAVVAMTEPVPVPLAGRLAAAFYGRLREHGFVDLALDEACAGEAGRGEVLIPTLLSRLGGRKLFDDVGPLTPGEWEAGLRTLGPLVAERAPVLEGAFERCADRARPALGIWKRTEQMAEGSEDARRARGELARLQADLNALCQDVLEGSFDALAKGVPLRFPTYDGRCPFPGLGVFDRTDGEDFRPFFFSREGLTDELRWLLEARRFVAVLGGSGSGKSSLVRAGLLEALRRDTPRPAGGRVPAGQGPAGPAGRGAGGGARPGRPGRRPVRGAVHALPGP